MFTVYLSEMTQIKNSNREILFLVRKKMQRKLERWMKKPKIMKRGEKRERVKDKVCWNVAIEERRKWILQIAAFPKQIRHANQSAVRIRVSWIRTSDLRELLEAASYRWTFHQENASKNPRFDQILLTFMFKLCSWFILLLYK